MISKETGGKVLVTVGRKTIQLPAEDKTFPKDSTVQKEIFTTSSFNNKFIFFFNVYTDGLSLLSCRNLAKNETFFFFFHEIELQSQLLPNPKTILEFKYQDIILIKCFSKEKRINKPTAKSITNQLQKQSLFFLLVVVCILNR